MYREGQAVFGVLAVVFFLVVLILDIANHAAVGVIVMDLAFVALAAALVWPVSLPWRRP